MYLDSLEQLRALYPAPKPRAYQKQLSALDVHCRSFIALSPFLVLASTSATRKLDASPRGGVPGFVNVLDDRTLLVPDAKGNNRLDTLHNIIETGQLGLIFLIPGVDETLRINGAARLSTAEAHLQLFAGQKNPPALAIEVTVQEAYLHCAKAFMRSNLWQPSALVPRSALPPLGVMIASQIGLAAPTETQEQMLARYTADL